MLPKVIIDKFDEKIHGRYGEVLDAYYNFVTNEIHLREDRVYIHYLTHEFIHYLIRQLIPKVVEWQFTYTFDLICTWWLHIHTLKELRRNALASRLNVIRIHNHSC